MGDTKHRMAREKVSELLGHLLRGSADIHFHNDSTVVCEDRTYHKLLHQCTDALKVCGHANWRKCQICKEYDDPSNLNIKKRYKSVTATRVYHESCLRQYNHLYYSITNPKAVLTI